MAYKGFLTIFLLTFVTPLFAKHAPPQQRPRYNSLACRARVVVNDNHEITIPHLPFQYCKVGVELLSRNRRKFNRYKVHLVWYKHFSEVDSSHEFRAIHKSAKVPPVEETVEYIEGSQE